MSYGLQVWNADGSLQLGVSDRLGRIINTISVTVTTTTKNLNVPGFRNDGTWAAMVYAQGVKLTTSNDTVSVVITPGTWFYSSSDTIPTKIYIYRC